MKSAKKSKAINNANSSLNLLFKEHMIYISVYIFVFIFACTITLLSDVSEKNIYYFSICTFVASGLLCGYISGLKTRKNGITVGLKSVALPSILVIIISLVMNHFDISIVKLIINALLMLLSGVVGGVAGVNTRIKPKKKRVK